MAGGSLLVLLATALAGCVHYRAEIGGGFTGATAGVLVCARVTATLGRDARATITDLPCLSSLNSPGDE